MTYPQDPNDPYGQQQPPSGGFQQPPSGGYQQPGYGQQYPSGGYPQPGYGQQYPGMGMQPKEGPGLAVGALICSIAGIFLCFLISVAGIIMGHIAYNKAKAGQAEGQGLAMAAFIVGYAAIALNILGFILIFGVGAANGLFR
ncbi:MULTISPECIES: DUF4190 domain-containing protein [unclassified Amycolatopsis]|uniref:DUF4190 domain-containing protein n=1 Tax=unclassified Amycolatopsis TaxID=2618356 RepID=UPI002E152957|nr:MULTISPECIES: DUF4190 domain-containing protein [unclassified Amycolatopsis]WSK80071.1 DUF4190 domain-containing protein [Amycolatopsis sp. NBC_01286]